MYTNELFVYLLIHSCLCIYICDHICKYMFLFIYLHVYCIIMKNMYIDCKVQPNAKGHRKKARTHTQSNLVRKSNCFQHVLHPKEVVTPSRQGTKCGK